jgi:hypothetical protein
MKSKLDGAGVPHTEQHSSPQLRALMAEAAHAAAPESIRWTQTAYERSAATRRDRIAIAAYHMSEARGFAPGHDLEDWALAQAQVDAQDADTFES